MQNNNDKLIDFTLQDTIKKVNQTLYFEEQWSSRSLDVEISLLPMLNFAKC